MSHIKRPKVTKVVSTKLTNEEYDFLQKLAKNYKSRGYIAKASNSEIENYSQSIHEMDTNSSTVIT